MTTTNAIDRLKKAGVSRSQIAAACGVSRQAVSYWSQGRSMPGSEKMAALVELAGRHGVVLLASDFAPQKHMAA